MARTVKDPEERRREILDAAMRLFAERGYDAVSMRDISRAAGITAGLCYHYFDSKQKLFAFALDVYAHECADAFLPILDDARLTLAEKMDALFAAAAEEGNLRYHEFFHAQGSHAFHRQLFFALSERLRPHVLAAVNADARRRGMTVESPEVLVDFILNGQLGIMTAPDAPDRRKLALVRGYLDVLLASQTRPAP